MTKSVFRAGTIVTVAAVLCSLVSGTTAFAISVPTTTTPHHPITGPPLSSAAKLLRTAVRDAQKQIWVHESIITDETDLTNITASVTLGTETVEGSVTTSGVLGSGTYSVIDLLKTNREYIKGSAAGLSTVDHFAFTDLTAPAYAGKWIRLSPAITENYTRVNGSTLSEQFSTLTLATTGRVTSVRYAGRPARAITEYASGVTETIYVSDAKKPLPLSYTVVTSGVTDRVTWSAWGRGVAPATPTDVVAFPAPSAPSTTSTTTPASANFCPAVTTLDSAYTAFVVTGSANTRTAAEYVAQLSALATELGGITTDLENVITTAPTPALAVDYTVLLGYDQALVTTLSLVNGALATLPANASQTAMVSALSPFEIRALLDVTYALLYTKPTNAAASAVCPPATTTTTTAVTTTTTTLP
jgi:hypothetical protein